MPISHFGSEPQREEDQEREKVMILRRRENRTWGKKELKAPEWPWMTCVLTYQNQNETKRMNLKSSVLSERSQIPKATYILFPLYEVLE